MKGLTIRTTKSGQRIYEARVRVRKEVEGKIVSTIVYLGRFAEQDKAQRVYDSYVEGYRPPPKRKPGKPPGWTRSAEEVARSKQRRKEEALKRAQNGTALQKRSYIASTEPKAPTPQKVAAARKPVFSEVKKPEQPQPQKPLSYEERLARVKAIFGKAA